MAKRSKEIHNIQENILGLLDRDYLVSKEIFKNTHTLRLTKVWKEFT